MNSKICKDFLYLLLLILTFHFNLNSKDKNDNKYLANSPGNCFDLSKKYLCYCSAGCAPRDKHKNDNPVWLENDPKGNKCYCQPWDLCKFDEICNDNNNINLKKRKSAE